MIAHPESNISQIDIFISQVNSVFLMVFKTFENLKSLRYCESIRYPYTVFQRERLHTQTIASTWQRFCTSQNKMMSHNFLPIIKAIYNYQLRTSPGMKNYINLEDQCFQQNGLFYTNKATGRGGGPFCHPLYFFLQAPLKSNFFIYFLLTNRGPSVYLGKVNKSQG